jgi:hypothetical protein
LHLWTKFMCISHKHILVHLGCHSITKTKQGPFTRPLWPPACLLPCPRCSTSATSVCARERGVHCGRSRRRRGHHRRAPADQRPCTVVSLGILCTNPMPICQSLWVREMSEKRIHPFLIFLKMLIRAESC